MQPLVSIIVPIYNVENYLSRCVDSLRAQTLTEIEIILVNDGSTDNSGQLVDHYGKIDTRIKVIHQENGGLSSARNTGMQIVSGKYIGFVDSDDWVEPEMYEKLYTTAKMDDSDIVLCASQTVINGKVDQRVLPHQKTGVYTKEEIIDEFVLPVMGLRSLYSGQKNLMVVAVWIHIYKTDIIQTNRVTFLSEREILNEDYLFNLQAYLNAKTISVIHDVCYNYELRMESLSRNYRKNMWHRKKVLLSKMADIIRDKGIYEKCQARITNNYLNSAIESINNECMLSHPEDLLRRLQRISEMTHDEIVRDLLSSYSTREMSIVGKLIFLFIKHNMSICLYLGYRITRRIQYYKATKKLFILNVTEIKVDKSALIPN